MKVVIVIARILLGLQFLIFGANALHPFMPVPPMTGDDGEMFMLMLHHGWFSFIGALYVVSRILLLVGRYVPIGLVILGPILVVILLFPIKFSPKDLAIPAVLTLLEVFLIYAYWPAFRGIFTAKLA